MSFRDYIKDKLIYIILILFGTITSEILLLASDITLYIRVYVGIIPILMLFICLGIEYYKKNRYYKNLKENMEELDEKYLISEIIKTPNFLEGGILKEILQDTGKSMIENVDKYKYLQEDYKEYIELWIHEIKMPIATSKMIIENNKTEITQSINDELDKIENYIEQALFYARSNAVEKDYYIRESDLKEIVNTAILKNKRDLIENKINIDTHDLEKIVLTDSKWCIFILNQIIQNAIKYSKDENKTIQIYGKEQKENVILYIKDNGIGIKKGEITRVFEKGFTGENGRRSGQKSTGIGLYLCKKLCDKLGMAIELNSEKGIGTEVRIVFPKSSYMRMEII
ncbi:MAG: ATP-binding protein [Clostridia bacterium]